MSDRASRSRSYKIIDLARRKVTVSKHRSTLDTRPQLECTNNKEVVVPSESGPSAPSQTMSSAMQESKSNKPKRTLFKRNLLDSGDLDQPSSSDDDNDSLVPMTEVKICKAEIANLTKRLELLEKRRSKVADDLVQKEHELEICKEELRVAQKNLAESEARNIKLQELLFSRPASVSSNQSREKMFVNAGTLLLGNGNNKANKIETVKNSVKNVNVEDFQGMSNKDGEGKPDDAGELLLIGGNKEAKNMKSFEDGLHSVNEKDFPDSLLTSDYDAFNTGTNDDKDDDLMGAFGDSDCQEPTVIHPSPDKNSPSKRVLGAAKEATPSKKKTPKKKTPVKKMGNTNVPKWAVSSSRITRLANLMVPEFLEAESKLPIDDDSKVSICEGLKLHKDVWDTLRKSKTETKLVTNALRSLWPRKTLANRSLKGQISNRLKKQEPKPHLSPKKVEAVYAMYQAYLVKDGITAQPKLSEMVEKIGTSLIQRSLGEEHRWFAEQQNAPQSGEDPK